MGLEMAELIMEVEDAFHIQIPEAPMFSKPTVRDLCLVVETIQQRNRAICLHAKHFYALRRAVVDSTGLPKRMIRPSTPIAHVLPEQTRTAHWRTIGAQLSSQELTLPNFPSLRWLIGLAVSFLFILVVPFVVLMIFLSIKACILTFVCCACLYGIFLRIGPWTLGVLPPSVVTVGDLARKINHADSKVLGDGKPLTREDIAASRLSGDTIDRVVEIVSETLCIAPSEFSLNSRFYEDLACS